MLYFYIVAAVGLVPILDNFFPIMRESYSWYLVPLLALAIFIALLILHFGLLALTIQCISLNKKHERDGIFLRRFVTISIPIFYKLARIHIHTSGTEKLPDDGRLLLVCNHKSIADPVIILSELPELQVGFIAKKEVYENIRFVAKALYRMSGLFIDRESNREAAKTIINAVKIIKEDRASIAVFPEGYTNRTDDALLPLRSGVFKIAERAEVPIAVCTLTNSRSFIKNMFRRRSDIYLDVAAVLSREELEGLHTDAVSERVRDIMLKSLEDTQKRIDEDKK